LALLRAQGGGAAFHLLRLLVHAPRHHLVEGDVAEVPGVDFVEMLDDGAQIAVLGLLSWPCLPAASGAP
jgi:hypothetical protein